MIRSHEQAVKVIFHRIAGGAVVSPGKSSTAHNFYFFSLPRQWPRVPGRVNATRRPEPGAGRIVYCEMQQQRSAAQHSTAHGPESVDRVRGQAGMVGGA
jgi:hypothetical protein